MRRIVVGLLIGAGWLVVAAAPAAAHSATGGPISTNWRSTLDAVTPSVPGLRLSVVDLSQRLELVNHGSTEVTVLGYQGEPYLRVGPGGVFENMRSPAHFLNQPGVVAGTPVPRQADPFAAPVWQRRSNGPVARWHDHRIHQQQGARPGMSRRWAVPLRAGDTTIEVTGRLFWVPGPSPWPWIAIAAVVAGAVAAAAVGERWPARLQWLIVLAIGIDAGHVVTSALFGADALGTKLVRLLLACVYPAVGWAAGLYAITRVRDRYEPAVYAVIIAGLVIALVGGVGDIATLTRSQVGSVLPPAMARAAVAASLGFGVGLVAAGIVVIRRHALVPATVPDDQ